MTMTEKAVADDKNGPDIAPNPWREHCLKAVRKFVMSAVVIDNQPTTKEMSSAPQKAVKTDEGMETIETGELRETLEMGNHEGTDSSLQDLNVRDISDAFANEEIACAFILPDDDDIDEAAILKRIIAAGMFADILILDWYLRDDNQIFTRRVLKEIAEKDVAEKGRMRLICIYTGQPLGDAILNEAKESLMEGGLVFNDEKDDENSWFGNHHALLILNKQAVSSKDLPNKLLEAMSKIADGLLPAFSMAAVAAIRRNMHHIIARFGSNLDAAFVANRLIKDPPTDVAELLKELFLSECDTALEFEKVLDKAFGPTQITSWFDEKKQPKGNINYTCEVEIPTKKGSKKENRTISICRDILDNLLNIGFSNESITSPEFGKVDFPEDKRHKISQALHGNEKESKSGERNLARFVTLKREAFGQTKLASDVWCPKLTLGTVLRRSINTDGDESYIYYYCLTPSCDTIRIPDTVRTFVLLELEEGKKFVNLLLAEENALKRLFINPKPIKLKTFDFRGDIATGCVQSKKKIKEGKDPIFSFDTVDDPAINFFWLGEVRQNRANRDMAELNRNWLRFGIHDSEFLRLAGKGELKI